MQQEHFPVEKLAEIRRHPQDFRLLERVPLTVPDIEQRLPLPLNHKLDGEFLCSVIFLDTETTGLMKSKDKIIELAMVKCTFSLDRSLIISVDRIYDEFEDPGEPLDPKITALTHIDDAMVAGQHFNEEMVKAFLADKPLVIAHNASFDRPFFERRFPQLTHVAWACSLKEISWKNYGSTNSKLEYLLQSRGWFYDAHRASFDCLALCFLMCIVPAAFEELLTHAKGLDYLISAPNAPYNLRKSFKDLGMRWSPEERYWYIAVTKEAEALQVVQRLKQLYSDPEPQVVIMQAFDRYRE